VEEEPPQAARAPAIVAEPRTFRKFLREIFIIDVLLNFLIPF
jgi:hypothetical protein